MNLNDDLCTNQMEYGANEKTIHSPFINYQFQVIEVNVERNDFLTKSRLECMKQLLTEEHRLPISVHVLRGQ